MVKRLLFLRNDVSDSHGDTLTKNQVRGPEKNCAGRHVRGKRFAPGRWRKVAEKFG